MKYIKSILLIVLFLTSSFVFSQEVMTLETSIQLAMDNNYNIKIAKNKTEISDEQSTIGNAGLLPTLSANGNGSYGVNNSTIEILGTPGQRKIVGAESMSYGGGVNLAYTLFNGLGSFYSYKKLKTSTDASEMAERVNVESVLLQTTQAYYQVVQAQNAVQISLEALKISGDRKERAKLKYDLAGGSRIDWLNAQVDFNTDSINYVNAINNFKASKFRLNQLTGKGSNIDYTVDTIILVNQTLSLDSLQEMGKVNNAALLNAEYNKKLAELDVKINRAKMQPSLTFQSNYNYNHVENAASVLAYQRTNGFTSSLQLSVPLFDGSKKSIQTQVSKIQAANAEYTILETETMLERDLQIAYSNYTNSIQIASLDQQSIETAQLNFERSKELFELGQISNTQFREAQLNLLRIKNQALNNQVAIKQNEIELLRLSGQLIK